MRKTIGWEQQYLNILKEVHKHGSWKTTRQISSVTGEQLSTKSIPSATIVVKKGSPFPLITVRPMGKGLRKFIGEMYWITSGDNTKAGLESYGVDYWSVWASEEMCRRSGIPEGTYGNTYGPQWRKYHGEGGVVMDQLEVLLWRLRHEPYDKRMRVIAWHAAEMNKWVGGKLVSTLPVRPCHGDFYLQWDGDNTIDMTCTQMSADLPIGIPSNIAMYRAFQEMICRITGYEMGDLTYNLFDAHYYSDQVEGVREILRRTPREGPQIIISEAAVAATRLMIDRNIVNPFELNSINPKKLSKPDWLMENIGLEGYTYHPKIDYNLLPVAI